MSNKNSKWQNWLGLGASKIIIWVGLYGLMHTSLLLFCVHYSECVTEERGNGMCERESQVFHDDFRALSRIFCFTHAIPDPLQMIDHLVCLTDYIALFP